MVLSKPQNSANREAKHRRRSVKFAASRPEIVARPDYSTEDRQNCWYSRLEYKLITFERRSSLQTLRQANFDTSKVDVEQHCPWGLEQMQSVQHLQHFKARQRAIVQAVLAEQKWQNVVSTPDPEALRLIAMSFSRVSLESALERAVQDARSIDNRGEVGQTGLTTNRDKEEEEPVIVTLCKGETQASSCSATPLDASETRRRPRIVSLQT